MVEIELGRLDRASLLLNRALGLAKSELPEGTRIRSDIHYHLGRVLFAQERLEEAETHYLKAFAGTDFPADKAKAAYNLARLYLDQERFEDAEQMVLRAIEEDSDAYSPEHAEVRKDLTIYAEILRGAGRTVDAEAIEARLGSGSTSSPAPAAPDS